MGFAFEASQEKLIAHDYSLKIILMSYSLLYIFVVLLIIAYYNLNIIKIDS